MSLFCKHKWKIITEKTLKSAFEQISEKFTMQDLQSSRYFFKKVYLCILQCEKCGKLNKTREVS